MRFTHPPGSPAWQAARRKVFVSQPAARVLRLGLHAVVNLNCFARVSCALCGDPLWTRPHHLTRWWQHQRQHLLWGQAGPLRRGCTGASLTAQLTTAPSLQASCSALKAPALRLGCCPLLQPHKPVSVLSVSRSLRG